MTESVWTQLAGWLDRWLQPLAFAVAGYVPADPEPPPDLHAQLEEIVACVREQELRWNRLDRIRRSNVRPATDG
ncbi:MAG TPA: hypothetical protein VKE27_03820 [Candidatus Dormibacteraeota bacterium]|nr:hypothetical protein [Candidatus Dormibacteraeota bacterium]